MNNYDIIKDQLEPLRLYNEDAELHNADIKMHSNQLDAVEASNGYLLEQAFVQTASEEGISWYEQQYKISPINTSLEERKTNVMAKEIGSQGIRPELLKLAIQAYGYEVEIIELFSQYRFQIKFIDARGIPSNITDLQAIVEKLKPGHLAFEFIFTYMTWSEHDSYNKTWNQWDALNLTWDEFEAYREVI